MVVVDQEPYQWFLLRDDDGYVIDVHCMQSFASFGVVMRLAEDEAAQIDSDGHWAADNIARSIQRSPSQYSSRSGGPLLEAASRAAITRWQANQPAA